MDSFCDQLSERVICNSLHIKLNVVEIFTKLQLQIYTLKIVMKSKSDKTFYSVYPNF